MKDKPLFYESPRLSVFEICMENGIAASNGFGDSGNAGQILPEPENPYEL